MISAIDRHPAVGWIRGIFLPEELVSVFDKDSSSLVKVLLDFPDDGYRNRAKEFLAKLESDENNKL